MSWYKNYRLVSESEGYSLEIYLDLDSPEFSSEFLTNVKESVLSLEDQVRKLVQERFSDVKINSAKLMVGTLVIGTLSFMPVHQAKAATTYSITQISAAGVVTASRLNMRTGPSTDYSIMHVLWQGNTVKVIGQSSGWYQIRLSDGRTGWVSGTYLSVSNQEGTRQQRVDEVINYAKSFLGTPYVYGGNSPSDGGFDCSGFTQYVFGRYGYTLNRISTDQALNGTYVSRAYLQPGDLIFYDLEGSGSITHVGIYLGDGKMIHSPKTGDVVKITDVSTSYWRDRYVTARRIIQ